MVVVVVVVVVVVADVRTDAAVVVVAGTHVNATVTATIAERGTGLVIRILHDSVLRCRHGHTSVSRRNATGGILWRAVASGGLTTVTHVQRLVCPEHLQPIRSLQGPLSSQLSLILSLRLLQEVMMFQTLVLLKMLLCLRLQYPLLRYTPSGADWRLGHRPRILSRATATPPCPETVPPIATWLLLPWTNVVYHGPSKRSPPIRPTAGWRRQLRVLSMSTGSGELPNWCMRHRSSSTSTTSSSLTHLAPRRLRL